MKKMVSVFAIMVAMIVSVTMFASSNNVACGIHECDALENHVAVQGKRCNGTVGCDCPGFSPTTNGDVAEENYCKHCHHRKSVHK